MASFDPEVNDPRVEATVPMPWKIRAEKYLGRLSEAQVYVEQGLKEVAERILRETLDDLEASYLPDLEKRNLRLKLSASLKNLGRNVSVACGKPESNPGDADLTDPSQMFAYAQVLMDGGFWDDALRYFKQVATFGYRVLESWELCGDCASKMEAWNEAIRYYQILYTNPLVPEANKQSLLHKITTSSQAQKQAEAINGRRETSSEVNGSFSTCTAIEPGARASESTHPSVMSGFEDSAALRLIGQELQSWQDDKGSFLSGAVHKYRIVSLLHMGMTSTVYEIEASEGGRHYAGQILNEPFCRCLSPKALAQRVHEMVMVSSPYLVRTYDLAFFTDTHVIVREHLPMSLGEVLSNNGALPIWLAISIAYQICEGIGYLHLHMGRDREIRKIYHLDLRPSRVLLHRELGAINLYNGGLWAQLQKTGRSETALRKLPLSFLPYRAPEQFRPYLARKKPPVFTDIYLFGTIFYEMLTGKPAFDGVSYEEYEIQHCDQYPTPPKVWRPEVPEELNDIIMKCLEKDPTKRWRSATQLSLALEKLMSSYPNPSEDGPFSQYDRRKRLVRL